MHGAVLGFLQATQDLGDLFVGGGDAVPGIHHEEDRVGFLDRGLNLLPNGLDEVRRIHGQGFGPGWCRARRRPRPGARPRAG